MTDSEILEAINQFEGKIHLLDFLSDREASFKKVAALYGYNSRKELIFKVWKELNIGDNPEHILKLANINSAAGFLPRIFPSHLGESISVLESDEFLSYIMEYLKLALVGNVSDLQINGASLDDIFTLKQISETFNSVNDQSELLFNNKPFPEDILKYVAKVTDSLEKNQGKDVIQISASSVPAVEKYELWPYDVKYLNDLETLLSEHKFIDKKEQFKKSFINLRPIPDAEKPEWLQSLPKAFRLLENIYPKEELRKDISINILAMHIFFFKGKINIPDNISSSYRSYRNHKPKKIEYEEGERFDAIDKVLKTLNLPTI